MSSKKKEKKDAAPTVALKKPKAKKPPPTAKPQRGLTNAELRKLMTADKPPQSWYDEDHKDLY